MNQIQAVIFDVDGTLYDYQEGKIHPSTIETVQRLKAQGIYVVLASARAYPELSAACIRELAPDYYVVAGGHSIQDCEGRVLQCTRFAGEQTRQVIELACHYDAGLSLKYERCCLLYRHARQMEQIFTNIGPALPGATRICPDMDAHGQSLPLGFTIWGEGRIREQMCASLEESLNEFRIERYRNGVVADIYHPQVNKRTGLEALTARLGLKREHCMAFGDGENDVEMLTWAGVGVAMGNACEELKRVANLVCGASWEDGIAHTVKQFGLIG